MQLRPGFKQTEVGVIPQDWEVVSLGSLCEIAAGRDLIKADWSAVGDHKYCYPIYANALSNKGLYGFSCAYQYEADKITVTARGDVGHAAYRATRFCAIGRLLVLSPKGKINLRLVTECINNCVEFALESTGVPQLTAPQISKYVVAIPLVHAEQEAIADALSDTDTLIESLELLITKKRQIKQGAMQELLTGKKRLPGFGGDWEMIRLGACLKFQVGFPFSSMFFNEEGQGIRLIRNRDLKSDEQMVFYAGTYDDTFVVRDGDVLVGMDGDFRPCVWTKGPALLNQRVGRARCLKGLDRNFSYYFLMEPLKKIEDVTSSTTVKHLSHRDIEAIEKSLPSLQEQSAIATILGDMDTELTELEVKLSKVRQLKLGMMQALLTGAIRLPLAEAV